MTERGFHLAPRKSYTLEEARAIALQECEEKGYHDYVKYSQPNQWLARCGSCGTKLSSTIFLRPKDRLETIDELRARVEAEQLRKGLVWDGQNWVPK